MNLDATAMNLDAIQINVGVGGKFIPRIRLTSTKVVVEIEAE